MKQVLPLLFLFVFCVNQLHILETIAKYHSKCISGINTDDASPSAEEDSEEKGLEKEIEYFIDFNHSYLLSKVIVIELNHNIDFLNSFYSNPFAQKDIKPPRCA